MDRKKIIEEGMLEKYFLGELSPEEDAIIERAVAEDSEVQKEFRTMEQSFERMAKENAISPPKSVRSSLAQKLETEELEIKRMVPVEKKGRYHRMRLLVAASLAAVFALTSFLFFSKWQSTEQMLQVVQQETSENLDKMRALEADFEVTNRLYTTVNDKDVIPLVLQGNKLLPEARAIAFVNHKTKSVVVNPQALPKLELNEDYQMWADVDGEMISMGILSTDKELVALTYIDKAESLNITIEPKGGNDHPTVERLISNIYL